MPQGVVRTLTGSDALVANAGRSVRMPSPFRSRPTRMLNGGPDATMMKGENDTPHFAAMLPPMKARWRTSKLEREYSELRLYWLDGKVPAPSLLPCAWP